MGCRAERGNRGQRDARRREEGPAAATASGDADFKRARKAKLAAATGIARRSASRARGVAPGGDSADAEDVDVEARDVPQSRSDMVAVALSAAARRDRLARVKLRVQGARRVIRKFRSRAETPHRNAKTRGRIRASTETKGRRATREGRELPPADYHARVHRGIARSDRRSACLTRARRRVGQLNRPNRPPPSLTLAGSGSGSGSGSGRACSGAGAGAASTAVAS